LEEKKEMRKIIYMSFMLLAVVGAVAGSVPQTEAAASFCLNPPANCQCRCSCGQLLKCCTSGGVTSCKPISDPAMACPQIAC
jgi:hypothetical protein